MTLQLGIGDLLEPLFWEVWNLKNNSWVEKNRYQLKDTVIVQRLCRANSLLRSQFWVLGTDVQGFPVVLALCYCAKTHLQITSIKLVCAESQRVPSLSVAKEEETRGTKEETVFRKPEA